MKRRLTVAALLLFGLAASGCTGAGLGGGGASDRCLSRPDNSGTQPMFYLFCVQQAG
jgi:hypothetical protein